MRGEVAGAEFAAVLALAEDEATKLGHRYVGTEHLLLGIVRLGEGAAVRTLIGLGANASTLRPLVIEIVKKKDEGWPPATAARPWWEAVRAARTPPLPGSHGRRMTPQARLALLSAQGEAEERKHAAVGTGHLMLGVIRYASTVMGQFLIGSDANTSVQEFIDRAIAQEAEVPSSTESGLTAAAAAALVVANDEAETRGHYLLGITDLLLGLLDDPGGLPSRALEAAGINPCHAKTHVRETIAAFDAVLGPVSGSQSSAGPVAAAPILEADLSPLFTDRVRTIIAGSADQARKSGDRLVEPRHLMVSLLAEGEGVGFTVLVRLGVDIDGILMALTHPPDESAREAGVPSLSEGVRGALRQAADEATRLGHPYIGSEHLLLALVLEGGEVAQALNLSAERVEIEIARLLAEQGPTPIPRRGTYCPRCGGRSMSWISSCWVNVR